METILFYMIKTILCLDHIENVNKEGPPHQCISLLRTFLLVESLSIKVICIFMCVCMSVVLFPKWCLRGEYNFLQFSHDFKLWRIKPPWAYIHFHLPFNKLKMHWKCSFDFQVLFEIVVWPGRTFIPRRAKRALRYLREVFSSYVIDLLRDG